MSTGCLLSLCIGPEVPRPSCPVMIFRGAVVGSLSSSDQTVVVRVVTVSVVQTVVSSRPLVPAQVVAVASIGVPP